MARRARRVLRRRPRDNKKRRKEGERRNGRMPLRWFGKRRRRKGGEGNNANAPVRKAAGNRAATRETRHRKSWLAVLAVTALAVLTLTVPQSALADGHWPGQIEYEIPEPVPGRRIFVEGLQVSGGRANVTLRAATDLDLRVRAYGGREGRSLRFWGSASLDEGERTVYSVPLSGESPSLTFSWEDGLGQAGAVTLKDGQIPYPLPSAEGELCRLSVASLGWTPGTVSGVIASQCVPAIEEAINLQTVAGHKSVTETALMEAAVAAITGTVSVTVGGSRTSVSFVPNGETRFSIPVATGKAVHGVAIEAELEAALRIAMPPMVRLTHHPERTHQPQRDGDGDPRGRDYDRAHPHGPPVHPQQGGLQAGDLNHRPPGARRGRGGGAGARRPQQERDPGDGFEHRFRRPLRGPHDARARAGTRPRRADTPHRRGDARPVRTLRMAVAVVRRLTTTLLLAGAALASVGAAPAEEQEMLRAISDALTAMAYAASGLCLFAIVWAGFVLMAEGGEERGGGRARSAVIGAVVGLVLVLSAKGVAVALLSGIVPIP